MSNAKTGLWSAVGALVGGAIGATAGKYVAQVRPRAAYGGGVGPGETEDAMVIGGASGAVLGAFIAGASTGEPTPAPQLAPSHASVGVRGFD